MRQGGLEATEESRKVVEFLTLKFKDHRPLLPHLISKELDVFIAALKAGAHQILGQFISLFFI